MNFFYTKIHFEVFSMHLNKKCITNFKHSVKQLGQEGAGGEWGGGWGGGGESRPSLSNAQHFE